ncbi:hypothetical protein ABZ734_28055 [Streptomyces sp. NPDC006660]|uniref:AMIN-like domain-containing (lipo)protein n=1 Tax=Streptomyces sp. NPDC006660 TaxID=3156901 RepID=UPI0033D94C1E
MLKNRVFHRIGIAAAALAAFSVAVPASAQAATTTSPTCDWVCVLDVRAGAQTGYDRLVFDLSGGQPTINSTETGSNLYSPPSGETKELAIAGTSYLHLNLRGADTFDTAGTRIFANPIVQPLSLPSIRGVQLTQDFEGRVEFVLSLGEHTRYNVSGLSSPERIVVDVYH